MGDGTPPRSVLIIVTRRIGDVLLATPLVRSVKRAWPQAALDEEYMLTFPSICSRSVTASCITGCERRPIFPSTITRSWV